MPFGCDVVEGASGCLQDRPFAGEGLPAPDGDIDVAGLEFHPQTDPAGRLRGDQGRAAAEERLVDGLAGLTVVEDRPAHALDRLLRAVFGLGVLILAGDTPSVAGGEGAYGCKQGKPIDKGYLTGC